MSLSLPITCCPHAFSFLRDQLPHLQSNDGLLRAAVAVSMHELDVQPAEIERQMASLSGAIRSRLKSRQRQAMLAHLHDELFARRGLRGNVESYNRPDNSYLPSILETGLGIPISLSLIYTVVARRLGLRADGINAPGHFLVRVADDTGSILIDPFHGGRQLSRDDARQLIESTLGGTVPFHDDMLRPATHRQWILRMLRNLVFAFQANREAANATAMREMMTLVESDERDG